MRVIKSSVPRMPPTIAPAATPFDVDSWSCLLAPAAASDCPGSRNERVVVDVGKCCSLFCPRVGSAGIVLISGSAARRLFTDSVDTDIVVSGIVSCSSGALAWAASIVGVGAGVVGGARDEVARVVDLDVGRWLVVGATGSCDVATTTTVELVSSVT